MCCTPLWIDQRKKGIFAIWRFLDRLTEKKAAMPTRSFRTANNACRVVTNGGPSSRIEADQFLAGLGAIQQLEFHESRACRRKESLARAGLNDG